jgi:hypothetical protein
LLTVDLAVGTFLPSFQNAERDPAGVITVQSSITLQQKNLGNTAADLTGGTPDNDDDNVFVEYFISSDDILDGADQSVGTFNLGLFDASLGPNGTRTATQFGAVRFTPAANANFLLVKIDSNNVLAETDENNNVEALDIRKPFVKTTGNGESTSLKKVKSMDPSLGFIDGESTDYNGGQIVAKFIDPQAKEFLQLFKNGKGAEQVRFSGGKLKVGGRIVGTVSGNKSSQITIDFTASIDQVEVQQVLRSIGYKLVSNDPATRNFSFQMTDPDARVSNTAVKKVNVFFE